ncbi:MAG: lytic transglycosylase domain-containing protein [Desulfobacteraceae bacterium]
MRTGLNLTIQDYFKQSGIHRPAVHCGSGNHNIAVEGGKPFSKVLEAARLSNMPEPKGLSIRDYLARPLTAQRSPSAWMPPMKSHPIQTPKRPNRPQMAQSAGSAENHADNDMPAMPMAPQEAPVGEKEQILASIDGAAKRYDLPKALIKAVVRAESGYRVRAVSPAGAQGLMQLMPATARELGVEDPFDIDQNIDGGAKYLRQMLDRFNNDIKLALSAYNAGPANVIKYDGQVPFAETRAYVDRVMRFRQRFL